MFVTLAVLILFLFGQKYVWGDETDTWKTYVQTGVVAIVIGIVLSFFFQLMGCVRAVQWFL